MSTEKNKFDVCVIGAGPAGFAAAMRCWDFGKSVAIIDKGKLGGAGLHNGALSSKTMWELSRDYRNATRTDRGFTAKEIEVNYRSVVKCVEQAISSKEQQMLRQTEVFSTPSAKHGGSIQLISCLLYTSPSPRDS